MKAIKDLIKNNPVLSFFILTFAISWGAILVLIALNGMPVTVEEAQAQLPIAIMTFLGGPLISGLLMIGVTDGRAGYRPLLSRLFKWRVSFLWYAIALLTAPLVFAVTHYLLMLFSPVYLPGFLEPNGSALLSMAVMSGIMVGICEEIGWFGFAIPKMRLRYNPLMTGLIVGVIWGAWHIMANDIWAIKVYTGEIPVVLYAVLTGLSFLFGQLPPFRILMVWAYERTGSLLLMMLMHASLTACSIACSPAAMSGWQVFIYSLSVAVVMWIVAATITLFNRSSLKEKI
jgi:membrane protease YdiL (CAAX protease family)